MGRMSDRGLRTQFSLKALDLAQTFRSAVGTLAIGPYHAELTAPDGPSTGGGVQAVQHVRLCADDGRPALVVGSCNQRDNTAELRSFDQMDAIHRQRFKRPLDVDQVAYGRFVEKAKAFLEALGMKVSVQVAPPTARSAGGGLIAGYLLGALVVGLLVAAVVWYLLHHYSSS